MWVNIELNTVALLIPFLVAAFLAVNMGASGTAPAFSAAYGAGVIKKALIPVLFTVFVFAGASLAGHKVSGTIGGEILPAGLMGTAITTIILLSVAITLLFCNLLRIPQSTSHTTVFAVAGCALFYRELESKKLFTEIIPAWFILPITAFAICWLTGKFLIKHSVHSHKKQKGWSFSRIAVVIASCYVAFAIGANNIGNIAGPLVSMIRKQDFIPAEIDPAMLLFMLVFSIVPWFGLGSAFLGKKLVKTTGRKIIIIRERDAVLISAVTATLLLLASVTKGIPTSLVQLNTGAVFGLGIARYGWRKIFFDHTSRMLWIIWFIAPLFAFLLSVFMLLISRAAGII
jgi:sulfate permease